MQRSTRAQAMVAALGFAGAVAYVLLPHSGTSELVLYDGVVLLAVGASVAGVRRAPRDRRLPWLLTTLGLAGFLVGELIWWWLERHGLDPYPSLADGVFLTAYLPLGLGAAAMASRSSERDRSVWLDAGILTLILSLPVWLVLMEPYAADRAISGWIKALTLAYPLADLFVLGFVLHLILTSSARTRANLVFAAGIVATATADLVFGWLDLRGAYTPGSLVDLTWLVGYLLIGVAALDPSVSESVEVDPAGAGHQGIGRLVAVVLAIVVPQVFLFIVLDDVGLLGLNSPTVTASVSTATVAFVATRLWALMGQARRFEERRASERLAALVDHSSDAIVLVDAAGQITYASPAVRTLWGRDPDEAVGATVASWFVDDDRTRLAQQIQNLVGSPTGTVMDFHGRLAVDRDGTRAFDATARNLLQNPNVGAIVITMRDVTAQRELEAQLERQAFHDHLTGLANRSLFADRVAHTIQRSARSPGLGAAVMFIDLDDFKSVNDGMGHSAGDQLLRQVADRIRICLRPADTVARLGGDEFAVLIEDLPSPRFATDLAGRMLEMLRLPMSVNDVSFGVSASIGVAPILPDSTVETILSDADIAMYSAKSQGKGRVETFDDSLRRIAETQLALKIELPRALRDGEFHVVYQPIHGVQNGSLSGFEALVRWEHPERGTILPVEFIPAAEESGLIVELGRWILREACRQAVIWNDRSTHELSMSVNVSAVQVYRPSFIDDVAGALHDTRLPAHLLTLELTESILIESKAVADLLEALRSMGVKIAIDDFGTGYSSLSYLQRLPITSVKIDRAFTARLSESGDYGLVRGILAIATALDMTTVAEGVENDDQLQTLRAMDCEFVQGYHLGFPLAPAEIDERFLPSPSPPSSTSSSSSLREAAPAPD